MDFLLNPAAQKIYTITTVTTGIQDQCRQFSIRPIVYHGHTPPSFPELCRHHVGMKKKGKALSIICSIWKHFERKSMARDKKKRAFLILFELCDDFHMFDN